ncbi:ankyrin repeat domain-containing protein [Sphingomonas sp. HITSZ_GF]|uniref:ankyrin repeat domain-containing protein n=1 Tax=Sphingomonas sp. HITSZ_GF TaxID=3037247 RepID=UPI00240E1C18|nr:ankyrin repeat domain-containing protein [Sphingomonas sp. HITSZ_GF]MDG2534857.1 ankyrin repeat domain-containing protein [Sphingomonas sp. HITSZ_GF]
MVSKTSLTDSIRRHLVDAVRDGLAARPDLLGYRDERGRNWLHLACSVPGTPIEMAELLLGLGLGLDDAAFTEGSWQATPLWFSIARGLNYPLAEYLLKHGCNPNYSLFAAAWNEDRATIRLLLDHGADIEEGVERGDTPLLGAVGWSKFGPVEELLRGGANPDAQDKQDRTALHLMLKKGSAPGHFAMFVRAGARGDIPDGEGRTVVEILRRKRDAVWKEIAAGLAQ